MKKNSSSRIARIMSTLMIVCGVLISGPLARAESAEGPCSNETLRGDYGFAIDGQILRGPATGLLRGVAMTHFDGEGNLSQVDFATLDGVPRWEGWRPVEGTYTVNADCTGTAELIPSDGSPTLKLRLIVVRNSREIYTVVEGNATGSIGIKRD